MKIHLGIIFPCLLATFLIFHNALNKAWLQDHHVCFEGQDFGDHLQPTKHHSARRGEKKVFLWVKFWQKTASLWSFPNANKLEVGTPSLHIEYCYPGLMRPKRTEQNTCRTEWHQCSHTCKIAKSAKSLGPLMVHCKSENRWSAHIAERATANDWLPMASRHDFIPFCEVINPWVWHHPEFATSFIQEPTCDNRQSQKGNNESAKEFQEEIVLIIHLKFKNTTMIHVSNTAWNISLYLVIRLIDRPGVLRTMDAKKRWVNSKTTKFKCPCVSLPYLRIHQACHSTAHGSPCITNHMDVVDASAPMETPSFMMNRRISAKSFLAMVSPMQGTKFLGFLKQYKDSFKWVEHSMLHHTSGNCLKQRNIKW